MYDRLLMASVGWAKNTPLVLPPTSDSDDLRNILAPFSIGNMEHILRIAQGEIKCRKLHPTAAVLTDNEITALWLYGQFNIAQALNTAIAATTDADIASSPFAPFLSLLDSAVAKLPKTRQLLSCFSTAPGAGAEYTVGAEFYWWGMTSMSRSASAVDDSQLSVVFVCEVTSSADISSFSRYGNDEEWVVAPGSQFRVVSKTETGDGLACVHIQQLE